MLNELVENLHLVFGNDFTPNNVTNIRVSLLKEDNEWGKALTLGNQKEAQRFKNDPFGAHHKWFPSIMDFLNHTPFKYMCSQVGHLYKI